VVDEQASAGDEEEGAKEGGVKEGYRSWFKNYQKIRDETPVATTAPASAPAESTDV